MPFELVPPGTHIDFIGKRRVAAAISIALLLAGAIAVPVNGVKLGIDFQGGTEIQVLFDDQVDVLSLFGRMLAEMQKAQVPKAARPKRRDAWDDGDDFDEVPGRNWKTA